MTGACSGKDGCRPAPERHPLPADAVIDGAGRYVLPGRQRSSQPCVRASLRRTVRCGSEPGGASGSEPSGKCSPRPQDGVGAVTGRLRSAVPMWRYRRPWRDARSPRDPDGAKARSPDRAHATTTIPGRRRPAAPRSCSGRPLRDARSQSSSAPRGRAETCGARIERAATTAPSGADRRSRCGRGADRIVVPVATRDVVLRTIGP